MKTLPLREKSADRTVPRCYAKMDNPSLTKQSFKDECDINKIMDKFQKTGALTHYANHAPEYQDIPSGDFLDAQLTIASASTMFEELPSSIRKKFENDPAKFLEFVQDEKNLPEMRELGLANPSASEAERPATTTTQPAKTTKEAAPALKEDSKGGTPLDAEGGTGT